MLIFGKCAYHARTWQMSFELSRSMGRAATILIIAGPVIGSIASAASVFFQLLPCSLYFSIGFSVLSFAAYILFLVAMNGFARYYKESRIFRNSLCGVIAAVAGAIVFIFVMLTVLIPTLNQLTTTPITSRTPALVSVFLSFLSILAFVWLGVFAIALIQGIFYRRAFYALAEKSGESRFRHAGFWMFIGGALTIIFVGAFIFYVGWIFAAMGFFSIKAKVPQTYSLPPQQALSQAITQKKHCPQCGAENRIDAVFCSYCGNKL